MVFSGLCVRIRAWIGDRGGGGGPGYVIRRKWKYDLPIVHSSWAHVVTPPNGLLRYALRVSEPQNSLLQPSYLATQDGIPNRLLSSHIFSVSLIRPFHDIDSGQRLGVLGTFYVA